MAAACVEQMDVAPKLFAEGTKKAMGLMVPTVSPPTPVAVNTPAGLIVGFVVVTTVTDVSAVGVAGFAPKMKAVSDPPSRTGMAVRPAVVVELKTHMLLQVADVETANFVAATGHAYMYVAPRKVGVAAVPQTVVDVNAIELDATKKATGLMMPAVNAAPVPVKRLEKEIVGCVVDVMVNVSGTVAVGLLAYTSAVFETAATRGTIEKLPVTIDE